MTKINDASRDQAGGESQFIYLEIRSSQNDMTGLGFFSELAENMDPDELLWDCDNDMTPTDSGEYVLRTEGNAEFSGRTTLSYFERDENGDPDCVTEISFERDEPGIITVSRSVPGEKTSSFIIEKGVRHYSVYETPYGPIEMCAYAREVENNVDEYGGEIIMNYSVELKGLTAQRTKMKIKVRPAEI